MLGRSTFFTITHYNFFGISWHFKKSLTISDSGPGYSRGDLVKLGTEPCLGLEKVISLIENNEDLGLIRVFGSPFTTFWSVMMLGFKVTVSSYPLGSDEQVIIIN